MQPHRAVSVAVDSQSCPRFKRVTSAATLVLGTLCKSRSRTTAAIVATLRVCMSLMCLSAL